MDPEADVVALEVVVGVKKSPQMFPLPGELPSCVVCCAERVDSSRAMCLIILHFELSEDYFSTYPLLST